VIASGLDEETWPLLEYLLEVADSSMTYRARYFTTLQPVAVLDLLMSDETNPRSLAFQIAHLADLYGRFPRHSPADLEALERGLALLRGLDLRTIQFPLPGAATPAGGSGVAMLDRTLEEVGVLVLSWAENVSRAYFDHASTWPISVGLW
jgi:hypothetical protein